MGEPVSGSILTTNRVTIRDLNEFGRGFSSLYHQYASLGLPKEGNAIRLLSIAPADNYYADIECELLQVKLDERPVYKALSYAWGDPGFTLPIFINGKSHPVTANCMLLCFDFERPESDVCGLMRFVLIRKMMMKSRLK